MYSVKPTNQFKRDLKLVQKRGYDIQKMTDVIKNSLRVKLCQKRIVTMLYLGISRDVGNVILSPTGC